jgi:hypothetical protein
MVLSAQGNALGRLETSSRIRPNGPTIHRCPSGERLARWADECQYRFHAPWAMPRAERMAGPSARTSSQRSGTKTVLLHHRHFSQERPLFRGPHFVCRYFCSRSYRLDRLTAHGEAVNLLQEASPDADFALRIPQIRRLQRVSRKNHSLGLCCETASGWDGVLLRVWGISRPPLLGHMPAAPYWPNPQRWDIVSLDDSWYH